MEESRLRSRGSMAFQRATTAFRWLRDHYVIITVVSGAILIIMGVMILSGELTQLNIQAQKLVNDLGLNFLF